MPRRPHLAAQSEESWVEKSNQNSQLLLGILARWAPTFGSQMGLPGVDEEIIQLPPDVVELILADFEGAKVELEKRLAVETHPAVQQDLEILIRQANLILEDVCLEQSTGGLRKRAGGYLSRHPGAVGRAGRSVSLPGGPGALESLCRSGGGVHPAYRTVRALPA